MTEATYLIVGAGSAGCVLANRLSAEPGAPRAADRSRPRGHQPPDRHAQGLRQAARRPEACRLHAGRRPRRQPRAGRRSGRAARCWAARARSTAWSTCAATPRTTTGGQRAGRHRLGLGRDGAALQGDRGPRTGRRRAARCRRAAEGIVPRRAQRTGRSRDRGLRARWASRAATTSTASTMKASPTWLHDPRRRAAERGARLPGAGAIAAPT